MLARFRQTAGFHTSIARFAYPVSKKGRPLPAFIVYSNEHRQKVKQEDPSLSTIEIGRKLGEMWRNLTLSQKEKYTDAFREAIDKYKASK